MLKNPFCSESLQTPPKNYKTSKKEKNTIVSPPNPKQNLQMVNGILYYNWRWREILFYLVQYGYILNSISCFPISDLVDGFIVLVLGHTCELAIEIQQEVAKFGAIWELRLRVYMEVLRKRPTSIISFII